MTKTGLKKWTPANAKRTSTRKPLSSQPAWKQAEKEFENHFENTKAAFIHRLSDTAQAKAVGGAAAFAAAQPSDYVVTMRDLGMFYAEVKSTHDEKSFHFSNIRKGQIGACRRQLAAGGIYLIFIKNVLDESWYCLPGEHFLQVFENKKHLTWEELEPFRYAML